jgi:hypothetical protein
MTGGNVVQELILMPGQRRTRQFSLFGNCVFVPLANASLIILLAEGDPIFGDNEPLRPQRCMNRSPQAFHHL